MSKLDFGKVVNSLNNVINEQFGIGENPENNLNTIAEDGKTIPYGKLGEFANRIDPSAERNYIEGGFNQKFSPNSREVHWQQPEVTVLVKKKFISSLSDNYRKDLSSVDEKSFLRASKILFQNKANQLENYERLCKIAQVSVLNNKLDSSFFPALFAAVDGVAAISNFIPLGPVGSAVKSLQTTLEKVKTLYNFTKDNVYTTWHVNKKLPYEQTVGAGTGVIEFTMVKGVNTSISLDTGGGSGSFELLDPLNLMWVTSKDIEKAISDTYNFSSQSASFFQLGAGALQDAIAAETSDLNTLRANREVPNIVFNVTPGTALSRRVRGIIDGVDEIKFEYSSEFGGIKTNVEVAPNFILQNDDTSDLGKVRLDNSIKYLTGKTELAIFQNIVKNIYLDIQNKNLTERKVKAFNEKTSGILKKMRLFYLGKPIVNPMDTVHIYMTSQTSHDPKISLYLKNNFNGLGFNQAFSELSQLQDQISGFLNPKSSIDYSIEKELYVGSDFPTYLWNMIKPQVTGERNGPCVFSGLVTSASAGGDDGLNKTINVSFTDNFGYLENTQVNFKPSLDVFNGPLFDPLTPFDVKFDRVTGKVLNDVKLLPENIQNLKTKYSRLSSGPNVNKSATQENIQSDAEKSDSSQLKKIYYDPNCFKYKWKEGIATQSATKDNAIFNASIPAPQIQSVADPFAGQDVINIISLLITGKPYNFANYYKSVIQFDQYQRDPATGEDPALSYYKTLESSLKKNNTLWGNFVPYKTLSIDDQSFINALNGQTSIFNANQTLTTKLRERSELLDEKIRLGSRDVQLNAVKDVNTATIDLKLADLEIEINKLQDEMANSLNKNPTIQLIGDDVTVNYDEKFNKENNYDPKNKKLFRRRIAAQTKRLIPKVRNNEDVNLFIVDDSYDKDLDIIADAIKLGVNNNSIFSSDFSTVKEKIQSLNGASIIRGIEIYCDSQGHINVKFPRYNRMPSSVFYNLIKGKEKGKNLFPEFLEDLYIRHIDNSFDQLAIIEDYIRLDAAVLGKVTDGDAQDLLSGLGGNFYSGALNPSAFSQRNFKFISSEGGVVASDFRKLVLEGGTNENPGQTIQSINDSISEQAKIPTAFDIMKRNIIVGSPDQFKTPSNFDNATSARIETLTNRISQKTNEKFNIDAYFKQSKTIENKGISSVDILNITQRISEKLAQRQKIIKNLSGIIKNTQEAIVFDKDNTAQNFAIFPSLFGNEEIPEIFETLIEDETYDDYGPNSGKRYVIKTSQIRSITINENAPKATSIEVQGIFDPFNNQVPQDLTTSSPGSNGGNLLTSAYGVDYDMWQLYGLKQTINVKAPFLSDPETQCSPYAVSILAEERENILQGSVTVIGNEYYQPGDVVYIDERDLLFYVTKVSHQFSYGVNFTTTLELKYGHPPGEYIPTFLDVVGKLLYKNQPSANVIVYKNDDSYEQTHLGTLVVGLTSSFNQVISSDKFKQFLERNDATIDKILNASFTTLTQTRAELSPVVELRIFGSSGIFNAEEPAEDIRRFLKGQNVQEGKEPKKIYLPQEASVQVVKIDYETKNDKRNLSREAFDIANEIVMDYNSNTVNQDLINKDITLTTELEAAIENYIIDVWIYFKEQDSNKA